MKRRTLLGTGLGAMVVAGQAARAQTALSLSLITDRPDAARALAARVAAVSGGAITLRVEDRAPADAAGFLAAVGAGTADLYLTADEAFVAINPAFGIFSAMPAGMSPSELEGWIAAGDGQFLRDALGAEHGVKSYMIGDDGPMPLWSRAPLDTLADLTRAAVGSTGLSLLALRAMGVANAVDIRAAAVDLASLDVLEGFSVSQMADAGLLGAFSHMTTPNAGRPSAALSVGVALGVLDALADADRALLERCFMAEHGVSRTRVMHDSAVALRDATITTHAMPDDIWDAQIVAASTVMSDMFASGNTAADVADGYMFFIGDVAGWSDIGETAFFEGRKRALSQ